MQEQFKIGDRVVDAEGQRGVVTEVTEYDGSVWYDVRVGRDAEVLRHDMGVCVPRAGVVIDP